MLNQNLALSHTHIHTHTSVVVHVFDVASGRELKEAQPLHHKVSHKLSTWEHAHTPYILQVEILSLSLSQAGPSSQRQLAFVDRNHDLFLTHAREGAGVSQTTSLGELQVGCFTCPTLSKILSTTKHIILRPAYGMSMEAIHFTGPFPLHTLKNAEFLSHNVKHVQPTKSSHAFQGQ